MAIGTYVAMVELNNGWFRAEIRAAGSGRLLMAAEADNPKLATSKAMLALARAH